MIQEDEAALEEARKAHLAPALTRVLARATDEAVLDATSSLISVLTGATVHSSRIQTVSYPEVGDIVVHECSLGEGVGARLWGISHAFNKHLINSQHLIRGCSVLELGSGVGSTGELVFMSSAVPEHASPPRHPRVPLTRHQNHHPASHVRVLFGSTLHHDPVIIVVGFWLHRSLHSPSSCGLAVLRRIILGQVPRKPPLRTRRPEQRVHTNVSLQMAAESRPCTALTHTRHARPNSPVGKGGAQQHPCNVHRPAQAGACRRGRVQAQPSDRHCHRSDRPAAS